ncbi:hypothetical protein DNTS_012111 [Danionella cerebrum]|uniref:RNA methyltransferase n=1 Tax=Danionella cerebrum TaxID=2873325 RepID=A0A553PUC1_9TELE|nr:hypothetical protein DNTS_012111 [Danionella translucida]TRY81274.1 hypothetical protein DNTS_012111 [Danionella translucida]
MWSMMSTMSEVSVTGRGVFMPHSPSCHANEMNSSSAANVVLAQLTKNPETNSAPRSIKNGFQNQNQATTMTQKLNKRRYSMNAGFKHPSLGKRRRRANSESDPVLPTNFLLGGNIFDPLNLNSLLDEDVSKVLNAETPKSSPLPAKNRDPVEILIPKDITDPLNLNSESGDSSASVFAASQKRRRHRNRHHATLPDTSISETTKKSEGAALPMSIPEVSIIPSVVESLPYELNTSINCRDEVVPPKLPQRRRSHPSSSSSSAPQPKSSSVPRLSKHKKCRRTISRSDHLAISPTHPIRHSSAQTFQTPLVGGGFPTAPPLMVMAHSKPQRRFQYGTYSNYYGYRTPLLSTDPRLAVFKPAWFRGKKVLDIGCNTGHVTLAIAKHWSPTHILGIDCDAMLIHAARQNLRYFLSELGIASGDIEGQGTKVGSQASEVAALIGALARFPLSFTRCRGPITGHPIMPHMPGKFPSNVSFLKCDYSQPAEDEKASMRSEQAAYDVIICLNFTKWIHLHKGDAGVKRLFHRIHADLRPGGVLILQPQPWSSYTHHRSQMEVMRRNYSSIRLKPDQFSSFLTTEVGFNSYEIIGTTPSGHKGKGCPPTHSISSVLKDSVLHSEGQF